MNPQIIVLDAGGQYCHLIARKVREQGVYAEVRNSDTPAAELSSARGVIVSGGPSSVYEAGSPTVDPALFTLGLPVLGICYGQQLMAHLLGGEVAPGERGEYGLAWLEFEGENRLLRGLPQRQQVWMSHRDTVAAVPAGFTLNASTDHCPVAAMADESRRLYGVQFHPEVIHTTHGQEILGNFLFSVCTCERDWAPRDQVAQLTAQIRQAAAGRNVFFFVSGGVDSAVAYTLCLNALGSGRVCGLYVDTGLMREGETEFVRETFDRVAPGNLEIEFARSQFLSALAGVRDPEQKRHIIGQEFVNVQERILDSHHFLDGHWVLGQGTIYPDTIESGGTKHASVIKTHHNRVAGIQKLIEQNALLEPLTSFYKDEVREIGRALNLPAELLDRHPFPGPGLAIRCLCASEKQLPRKFSYGWLIPLSSVGVQGDSRSYRQVMALEIHPCEEGLHEVATRLINQHAEINRVIAQAGAHNPLGQTHVYASDLNETRLNRLRRADAIVRQLSHRSGYDATVWQFPVVLIPLGTLSRPDSVVLRPVDSVDGMTARAMPLPRALLDEMVAQLVDVDGVHGVFLDLTHKPPGTIEWE